MVPIGAWVLGWLIGLAIEGLVEGVEDVLASTAKRQQEHPRTLSQPFNASYYSATRPLHSISTHSMTHARVTLMIYRPASGSFWRACDMDRLPKENGVPSFGQNMAGCEATIILSRANLCSTNLSKPIDSRL
ncbi:hypothetical protein EJ02DRAFT_265932 [Clathrospora elynae]|uniref:Uncharacterized protein n=1 Tax=Clathrospora elynae TaxID=706981 RepID=A0A6A5SG95_9PLEO|nr:hypothetical protein EJ02DRAFT_265932 [Clathrospora elynae]